MPHPAPRISASPAPGPSCSSRARCRRRRRRSDSRADRSQRRRRSPEAAAGPVPTSRAVARRQAHRRRQRRWQGGQRVDLRLAGATAMRRLTLEGKQSVSVWSADGERVAFQSDREGDSASSGSAPTAPAAAERLTKPDRDTAHVPESWSPDGKTLLVQCRQGVQLCARGVVARGQEGDTLRRHQSSASLLRRFRRTADGWRMRLHRNTDSRRRRWVAVRPAVSHDRREVSDLDRTASIPLVSRWEGTVLLDPGLRPIGAVSVTTRPSFTFGNPVPVPRGGLR